MPCHESGHLGVLGKRLLLAPAVEVEVDGGLVTGFGHDEHRAGVAQPQVVVRAGQQLHRVAHQLPGQRQLGRPHQQGHGFVPGDGLGDGGQVPLHFGQKPAAPDLLAGAKGHPGALVRRALVGHAPRGAPARARESALRATPQRARPDQAQGCGHGAPGAHGGGSLGGGPDTHRRSITQNRWG